MGNARTKGHVLGKGRTCYFQGVTVEITYKNMLEIILTTQEITIDFFGPKLRPFWPYDVILTPKNAFLGILSNFCRFSPI